MKTPADTGGGGGSTCGGDLLPRETGGKNFGRGLKGFRGARLIPSSGGTPSTRNLLLLAARAEVLPGSPNSVDPLGMVWVLRVLVFSCSDPATWALQGSLGWQSPSQSFCHVALRGPGRVRGEGGGFDTGARYALRYAVRPVTFTAARAPHRVSGLRDGPEQGVSGEHRTRGPSCTAPPPSVSSLPRPH